MNVLLQIGMEGILPYYKEKLEPGFRHTEGWQQHLKINRHNRHYENVSRNVSMLFENFLVTLLLLLQQRIQMLADYGRIGSYLTDRFAECSHREPFQKKMKKTD